MPLSSRERLLAVLHHQEPDYVPLLFNSFGFKPPAHLSWSNQVEQARTWLSLGADAWLWTGLPFGFHPEVKVREWAEKVPGNRWPLMVKEYDTPVGKFRQEVFRTEDWVSSDWPGHKSNRQGIRFKDRAIPAPEKKVVDRNAEGGIQLFDDYNVPQSRSRRYLVETEQDVEKLKYLLCPPSDEAIAQWRERASAVARQAEELGVMLIGWGAHGTDVATWLCGVEGMVLMALDQPETFNALLDVVQEWDKRNVELLLDTPVDLILRRGYYEGTIFWSPALYRRLFAARNREITHLMHQGSRLAGYTISAGFMPLLDILVEVGYDAHYDFDPIQQGTHVDLRRIKSIYRGRVTVVGGVNEPITMEQGTRDAIRQEVFDAVRALAPGGGLILNPAGSLVARTPWESVEAVIEAWKEVRDYPIAQG